MIELFNEYMQMFALFVTTFFKFEFVPGVSVGWLLVAINVLGLVIYFLFGRIR